MKIVTMPVREHKDPNELLTEMMELIASYEISVVQALGFVAIVNAELIEQSYID
jgi:folate-dependent phosphoribosylglycinamide formyltransferase PurN